MEGKEQQQKSREIQTSFLVKGWDCEDKDKEDDTDNDDISNKEKSKKENKRNQRKWETFHMYRFKIRFIDKDEDEN